MTNATLRGKPDAGNLHVRFDEGEVASAKPRRGSLLYKKIIILGTVIVLTSSAFASNLRGFGNCTVSHETWSADGAKVEVTRFTTTGDDKAETVLGKFLHDLDKTEGIVNRDGVRTTTAGTSFACAKRGVIATIAAADSAAALAAYRSAHPEFAATEIRTAKCPAWMKRFNWGVYGMGGLENFHNWMQSSAKAPKGGEVDPRPDFEFLKEMGDMRFENWAELDKFDHSDGITERGVYWRQRLAEQYGLPYSYRFYMPVNGFGWENRRFADMMEKPASWMTSAWLRYGFSYQPHLSWYQKDGWGYFAEKSYQLVKQLKTDDVAGWMHPAGELLHQPWYDMHSDYSAAAAKSWADYLREHGITLADLGLQAWDQVVPPEFADFTGKPGMILDLAGTWRFSKNGKDFETIELPGNWDLCDRCFSGADQNVADPFRKPNNKWRHCLFTRSFDFDSSTAKGKSVYFYFFPMSQGNQRHSVKLNGRELGPVGKWCGIDVTADLKPLANVLEIVLEDHFWDGRIFLSTEKPAMYPNLPGVRNRLFSLWNDWRRAAKEQRCAEIFDGMRQADPNAPIKFMAPRAFGWPIINRLMTSYGGFAHHTGEGMWFFPWYKRYGKLWGYEGTSELAGPYNDIAGAQRSTLRVFLAGLDCHEPVFLTQTYSRNPVVRDWWLKHRPLLNRMGTYDIFGPQILLYRRSLAALDEFPAPVPSLGGESHNVNTPWDWDFGRGTFQSLGQSSLYIDDDGIEAGKMYDYKLMVDAGNEIVEPAAFEKLAAWVKEGGIYVALPFTGRSTVLEGDSWPIAKLAAAKPAKLRALGGKVTYKGRVYDDKGSCVNCNGNNLNEYSVELEPTSDEVETIARYENGAPAIVVRKLGRGKVIWLGSAFWRDCADRESIWWSGEGERAFWKEFLADIGFDRALCETSDALVWAQPYRSNAGNDFVSCLCNFNKEGPQEVTVTLRVPRKPSEILVHSGEGVARPDFTYADGVATLSLALPAQEVAVVTAADVFSPTDALSYWWREQNVRWRELKPCTLDLAQYRTGRWADPTQDLKENWTMQDGRPCVLDALQYWGLADGAAATVRKTFDLKDVRWLESGRIRLVAGAWVGKNFLTPGDIFLNGVKLTKKRAARDYLEFDVTALLKETGNELVFDFDAPKDGRKFTGAIGSCYLYHRKPAARSLKIASLPLSLYAPEEWKGKYRVFLHIEAPEDGPQPPLGVKKGSHFMRKHHHNFGFVTDIDITSLLEFGKENVLEPLEKFRPKKGWDFSKMKLSIDLFEEK